MGNESFLSGLFDVSFQKYISRPFLRVLYIIAIIVIGLNLVLSILSTWGVVTVFDVSMINEAAVGANEEEQQSATFSINLIPTILVQTLIAIIMALVNLVMIRISLEIFQALVAIAAAWGRIKQRGMQL
ncbi:DUF4282 domain-containing protein [Corynebacterium sp. YSMAA1_1_F7]|uniref:DUF4282 domain-containing protein n=1 Tax=Corynebacterium sp. YSMAA1_1_F7 TaxID=3383590 RepID=UPI0038D1368B